jgi:thiol-disulfide isomerase/thioredoxin
MKKVKNIIILSIIVVLCTLFYFTYKKIILKETAKENMQRIDDFELKSVTDSLFSSSKLPKQPIALIFFHPECDICQAELEQLLKMKEEFAKISILLVTHASEKESKDFYIMMNLAEIPNIQLLLDTNYELHQKYFIKSIPSIYLYDSEKKLIKYFIGEIKMNVLLNQLKVDHE